MKIYQIILFGLTLPLAFLAVGEGLGNAFVVVGLSGVALIAERGRVRLDNSLEVSISLLPTVFAAAVFAGLILASWAILLYIATVGFVMTFNQAYALYFLGGRYPLLGNLLEPPPPVYPYAPTPPTPPPTFHPLTPPPPEPAL